MEEPGFCQLPSISMLSSPLGYLTFHQSCLKLKAIIISKKIISALENLFYCCLALIAKLIDRAIRYFFLTWMITLRSVNSII